MTPLAAKAVNLTDPEFAYQIEADVLTDSNRGDRTRGQRVCGHSPLAQDQGVCQCVVQEVPQETQDGIMQGAMAVMRSGLSIVLLLVAISVTAYFIALINGAPPPQLSILCMPNDGGTIGCIRAWIDPVAAVFTVVAIIYAALQVFEANRQSDAAVRSSLVARRADISDERAHLDKVIAHLEAVRGLIGRYSRTAKEFGGEVPEEVTTELVDLLHSKAFISNVHGILSFHGSGVTGLDLARSEASIVLTAQYVRWREVVGVYLATLWAPDIGRLGKQFGTDAEGMARQYRRTFVLEAEKAFDIDAWHAARNYGAEIDAERTIINDVIAELDQGVLKSAREHYSSRATERDAERRRRSNRIRELV